MKFLAFLISQLLGLINKKIQGRFDSLVELVTASKVDTIAAVNSAATATQTATATAVKESETRTAQVVQEKVAESVAATNSATTTVTDYIQKASNTTDAKLDAIYNQNAASDDEVFKTWIAGLGDDEELVKAASSSYERYREVRG